MVCVDERRQRVGLSAEPSSRKPFSRRPNDDVGQLTVATDVASHNPSIAIGSESTDMRRSGVRDGIGILRLNDRRIPTTRMY
jgi:hypothetical protein